MEVCAVHKRYNASGLRTVVIGKPGDEVKRAHDACLAGVTTVIDHLRSGASAQDAARHAGNALRAIEPDLVWHGYYGYSVGLAFPPACTDCQHNSSIVEQEELILQPGMVFHCSVSLRKVRHFGVTVGDTVVVTEQGHQVLTNAPRELIVK
jgi:Xaa-Pro aminopeptidase